MSARFVSPLLLLLTTFSTWAAPIEVSPNGPIPTLAAARDAVRKARTDGEKGPITVRVAEGVYPLTDAIVFEPQDSNVIYEAAPGAKPVFDGGKKIRGFTAGADGVWTAKVDPAWRFEALWVNGQRATRARTPNEGFFQAIGQPTEPVAGVPLAGSASRTLIRVEPKDAKSLQGLTPAELRDVNTLIYHSWDVSRLRLAGARVEDGTLQFTGGVREFFSLEPWHRVHFENYRAALDAPGEWFLARDGTLSYIPRPGEKIETAEVSAPVAQQWLIFQGDAKKEQFVEKLTFRGLSFRGQAYELPDKGVHYGQAESGLLGAIEANGTRDLTFERCAFSGTLTHALRIQRGCRDVAVRQCSLHDLGAGGIYIGDPGVSQPGPDHTSHVTVDNCIIHTGGRYFMAGIGVLVFHASDVTIRHCDIADFFYTAISTGWTWGYKPTTCARILIEHCHLHHLGWGVLSDMGGVYTLGPQPGSVIRGCHIHDIGCASYGAWGMYNDEGSTGILWENNLVHDTQSAGYHQHYGRGNIVRNNIIAFGAEEHVRWSRPEDFFAFAFERNIVLLGEGRLFMHVDKTWDTGRVWLNDNVYWKPDGPIKEFAGKSWADWQFLGRDPLSIVADPLFVAPDKGDWTLQPESPALKLGFQPFDWKLAGVTGDAAWQKLAATDFGTMAYGLKPKAPPLDLEEGFETTPAGAKPSRAKISKALKPALITVTADHPSTGARCLQLTDGPDVEPAFEPHFFYTTNVEGGIARVSFDVRLEPDYVLVHEWRDNSTPYRSGPQLTFEKGAVRANGKTLAALPPNEWVKVEITARIDGDATWNLTLTFPGQEPQRFDGLKFVKPDMQGLKWIGWASNGKAAAKCWIDNIHIHNDGAK
jgi:hypothetical protein